jgi:hypothetical protein
VTEAQRQSEQDARTLALVREHLEGLGVAVADDQLRTAIVSASPFVRSTVRSLARDTKRAERAVPVFRVLADTDEDSDDHGWLAYKLRDQGNPDWKKVESELTIAISRRPDDFGWYQYTRALARINQEDASKPSARRDAIRRDLHESARDPEVATTLAGSTDIKEWLARNKLALKDVLQ